MSGALGSNQSDQRVHYTRGASYLIFQNMAVSSITAVAFIVLARLISTKEMGIWVILQLIVATCAVFATWFPQAVTKYVAENTSRGAISAAAAAFYQALRVNVVIYLPVIAGFYLGATFLASHLLGDISYAPLFQVLALDVFLSAGIIPVVTAALLGLRLFRETAVVGIVVGGVFRQLLIIILIVLTKNFVGLVIGWLISDGVTAAIYLVVVFRALGAPRFDFPLIRLFRFYLPLELMQIVTYAQTWFDRVLLVLFAPLAMIGIYNASATAYGVVSNVSTTMNRMILPAFSSVQTRADNLKSLRAAIRLATRYACLIVIPTDMLLLATARPALALIAGPSYTGAGPPLIILCAADAITAFGTVLGSVFLALEETGIVPVIFGVSAGVGVVSGYLMVPKWGIVGAAIARAASIILIAILQVAVLKRKMNLQLDNRNIAKTFIAGAIMAALVEGVQMINYSKFMFPFYVLIGVVIYLVMLRLLRAVDADDLDLLSRFLGKRFSMISRILSWIILAPVHRA